MNDQEIYLLLKQAGNSLQAIFDYFKKKNKILFDSTTSWDSGTKTIKGIRDYNIIQCNLDLGGCSGLALRHHDTAFFGTANANYPAWFATAAFYITLNGDAATLNWGWVSNVESKAPYTTYGIKRIIGVEPVIPDALGDIIGGGYRLKRYLRERCIGYVQSLEENLLGYKKFKIFKANERMGKDCRKFQQNILRCEKIQRIAFRNIFRWCSHKDVDPCGDTDKQCTNSFCRYIWLGLHLYKRKHNINLCKQAAYWVHSNVIALWQIKGMGWCV